MKDLLPKNSEHLAPVLIIIKIIGNLVKDLRIVDWWINEFANLWIDELLNKINAPIRKSGNLLIYHRCQEPFPDKTEYKIFGHENGCDYSNLVRICGFTNLQITTSR